MSELDNGGRRILARQMARELTASEVAEVSGGSNPTPSATSQRTNVGSGDDEKIYVNDQ